MVPIVPTVISADPSAPKRASLPSMLPPGLSATATWETLPGNRLLPWASACMEITGWARNNSAMTATRAWPWRRLPIRRPNMKAMANGSTMTNKRSNMLVKPVGVSNGWAPPAP